MACALNITHALVPPTPGTLAVVAQFGDRIDLGTYILFGLVMGIPLMIIIAITGRIVGQKWYKIVDENGEIVDVSPEQATFEQVVEITKLLSQIACSHGITIVIEPIRKPECNIINSFEEGVFLAKIVQIENIKVLIDYYHMTWEQEPPEI